MCCWTTASPSRSDGCSSGTSSGRVNTLGWDHLENGDLLNAAAPQYDVFVTVDTNLEFQRHTGDLPMTVIALVAPSNRPRDLAPLSPEVVRLLGTKLQQRVYVVGSVKKRRKR